MGPSSAGAIGWMQFMPDTWLRWGTDANGDGVADPWNPEDAVFSAARYLAASGGQQDIAGAVFSYNHADWYVNEVLQLANLFGSAGADTTFTLDRLQASLDQAQSEVAAVSQTLANEQHNVQTFARERDALLARANGLTLLSAKIELERRATLADLASAAAQARVEQAGAQLVTARTALDRARSESQTASFAQGASSLFSTAQYSGNYVFPVGGGPSVVSASHTHHDFPAVDIAAPEGSPEYALSNAVVERVWRVIDPACGMGMTIRTADGLVWTYCHMSYVDPAVQVGAVLSAGQPVGLVGSTGDATGPHLHLQLQPPILWPQRMGWFQSFAGTAFRWQDAPTPGMAQSPVFGVASDTSPVVAFSR
jgi:murein DD-endopeptidase MepM/ murein hydrolase activator NlpD